MSGEKKKKEDKEVLRLKSGDDNLLFSRWKLIKPDVIKKDSENEA